MRAAWLLAAACLAALACAPQRAEAGSAKQLFGAFSSLNPFSKPDSKPYQPLPTKPVQAVPSAASAVVTLSSPPAAHTESWTQVASMGVSELQSLYKSMGNIFTGKFGGDALPKAQRVQVSQCMSSGKWQQDTFRRAATAVYLAIESYNIGTPKIRANSRLAFQEPGQPIMQVVSVDLNGYKSKYLGDYTGPFMAVKQGSTVWLAFRGSDTATDWAHDLTAVWTEAKLGGFSVGKMHLGFAEIWQQYGITARIRAIQAAHPDVTTFAFTGHSLGGALAQLAALEYSLTFNKSPSVFTFGSPRVFGQQAHDLFKGRVVHYRFKDNHDPVPSVPTYDVACTLAASVDLRGALAATGADAACADRFFHAADASVRLVPTSQSGSTDVNAVCILEDNSNAGYNVMDHMGAKYGNRIFRLAIKASQDQGYNFNKGVNLYPNP